MAGGFEGENPTRRYKWFRPRQAARGFITISGVASGAVLGLFNNSSGSHYLVVRHFSIVSYSASSLYSGFQYLQGQPGTLGGTVTPLLPGQASLAGQLWSQDSATPNAPDLVPLLSSTADLAAWWPHDFPVAIIAPGWSWAWCTASANANPALSLLWEAIYPEELDWLY